MVQMDNSAIAASLHQVKSKRQFHLAEHDFSFYESRKRDEKVRAANG
tara:strand:- start:284 stop:424 length:141 start_codon:yes stop_codon:yes gene_type:complete